MERIDDEPALPEELIVDDVDSSQQQPSSSSEGEREDDRVRQRWECLACWIYFFLLFAVSYAIPWPVYKRPIPVQRLGDNLYVRNQAYNEPVREDTVSTTALVLICGVAPFVVQMVLSSFGTRSERRRVLHKDNDRHQTLCVYLVAISTNNVATEALKLYCGSLRPIFYAICQPDEAYETCTTTDSSELDDARKSFPSGHASQAWNGLFLLTLYLHQTWGVGGKCRRSIMMARGMSFVAVLPVVLATWIAASRIRDNQHFAADVVGGSMLGAAIAYYVHGVWFEKSTKPRNE
eukprot:scaffold983_cov168-Amphora_coffeaeformis.AAC.2